MPEFKTFAARGQTQSLVHHRLLTARYLYGKSRWLILVQPAAAVQTKNLFAPIESLKNAPLPHAA
jgi:hypothetical protein